MNQYTDALGHVVYSSGPCKLGTLTDEGFVSSEYGTTLDLPFGEDASGKDYFDPVFITDFLHQNAEDALLPAA